MKNNRAFIFSFAFAFILLLGACGCEKPNPGTEPRQGETEQADLSLLEQKVLVTDNWVWSERPKITLQVKNPNKAKVKVEAKVKISTDMKQEVTTIIDSIEIAGSSTQEFVLSTKDPLAPGIYRANCFVNGKTAKNFYFAIDPLMIVSEPDAQPDFDEFWQNAKDQLAAIDMAPNLIELPSKSTDNRKVYLVELNSIPDGLEGEPVKIRGYYCEPQDGKKHPVIMHFYGYDTQGTKAKVECPSGNGSSHAEFYLSHRGQYINNRPESSRVTDGLGDLTNIYGDWASYHFGDKDSYYYRGAFMDVVQAVRFMATRETSDMTKLCAEGSSQGGALTYVCAALSDYPCVAIAANVAFLGDFADAMKMKAGLAYWEMHDNKGSMNEEEVLEFMSYFDMKNLTPRIHCAVLASTGLQDDVCPPRTNIVPFNNLGTPASDKEIIFGPEMGHAYPGNWNSKMHSLFKSKIEN